MPNTKLTKVDWKNHMQYGKIVYLALILLGLIGGDMVFTMTEPRTPNDRKVDFYIVSSYVDVDGLQEVGANALLDGQAYERARDAANGVDVDANNYELPLEEVNIYFIGYDEENDDGYGSQSYMVRVMSMEGDVYIVTRSQLEVLISQGGVAPLDDFIADGLIDPGDRDLANVTYDEYVDEEEEPTGIQYVYALQAEPMFYGMATMAQVDVTDYYIVIMSYCENKDTAAAVMGSFIRQMDAVKEPEDAGAPEGAEPADDGAGNADGAEPTEDDAGNADGAEPTEDDAGNVDGAEPTEDDAGNVDGAEPTEDDAGNADGAEPTEDDAGNADDAGQSE